MLMLIFFIAAFFLVCIALGWLIGCVYGSYILIQTVRGKDYYFPTADEPLDNR